MKTAVLAFGRMNPITEGHQKLVEAIKKIANKEKNATPIVLLSHSQDPKKNPLAYDEKIKYARSAFGAVVRKSKAKNVFEALVHVNSMGFDRVIMVAGGDRVKEYERILKNYNGKDFKFEDWKVETAGDRDPDSEGVSGASASKARDAASVADFKKFKDIMPSSLSNKEVENLYNDVRDGLQINEEDFDFEIEDEDFEFTDEELDFFIEELGFDEEEEEPEEIEEVLSVAQRRKKGRQLKRKSRKMARKRKIRQKRKADPERLKGRARRAARTAVKKKVSGKSGKKLSDLSPTQKMAMDKRLSKRKKQVDRLSKRMLPKVRKKERERLSKSRSSKREEYEEDMKQRKSINESFDRFISSLEKKERKVNRALREKAHEYEVPVSIVKEVYDRGLEDFQENGKKTFTESQWAFARVNSFVEGGKAQQIDEDLWSRVEPTKNLMERINGTLNEAKGVSDEGKVVTAVLDTFESLNKKSNVSKDDVYLVKLSGAKWQLWGENGGDMMIDNKRAATLNINDKTRGVYSEIKDVKAKDLVQILKNQGIEERKDKK